MRQVLVLYDVEGYTHEEIGRALGITSGTSKSQLFKARARCGTPAPCPRRRVENDDGHLTLATLARLVDEAPDTAEAAHLAVCDACREELATLRETSRRWPKCLTCPATGRRLASP